MYEGLAMWSASAWKVSWAPDRPQLPTLDSVCTARVLGCRMHMKAASLSLLCHSHVP